MCLKPPGCSRGLASPRVGLASQAPDNSRLEKQARGDESNRMSQGSHSEQVKVAGNLGEPILQWHGDMEMTAKNTRYGFHEPKNTLTRP